MNNAVIVSGGEQRDLAIHTYVSIHPPPQIFIQCQLQAPDIMVGADSTRMLETSWGVVAPKPTVTDVFWSSLPLLMNKSSHDELCCVQGSV